MAMLAGSAARSISTMLKSAWRKLEESVPSKMDAAIQKAEAALQEFHRGDQSLWKSFVVPGHVPRPSNVLLAETLQLAVRSLRIRHYDASPPMQPLLLPSQDLHGVLLWRLV